MTMRKFPVFCVASSLAVLTGCSAGQPPTSSVSPAASAFPSDSLIGNAINRAMDKASAELTTKNITVSNNDNEPKAEITPQGDFLIEGKAVPLTTAQRTEVLAYRGQLIEIGRSGIAVGRQGATLGVNAASEAIAGAFSGQSQQQIRQRVGAQTSGIREAAAKICDRLPALMASQQKLAAALPAFKPYATMAQQDINDCRRHALNHNVADKQMGESS